MPIPPPPSSPRPEGFPGQRLVVIPNSIVHQAATSPITRDLCISHIGHFSATPEHMVHRPHGSPQHILIACLAGNGSCSLHHHSWQISPGDLLFLPPNHPHTYQADPSHPWTIFWIHFLGQRALDYLHRLGVSPTAPILSLSNLSPILAAFEETFQHTTHGFSPLSMLGMSTSLSRLLGLTATLLAPSSTSPQETTSRLLHTLSIIRSQLDHPWTLAEMAHLSGTSIPHFSSLCRHHTGMAPISLLIRLRLQRAMVLLQQGNLNVAEAANAVGYSDPFYFSRLFKKNMGFPPSACRNGP